MFRKAHWIFDALHAVSEFRAGSLRYRSEILARLVRGYLDLDSSLTGSASFLGALSTPRSLGFDKGWNFEIQAVKTLSRSFSWISVHSWSLIFSQRGCALITVKRAKPGYIDISQLLRRVQSLNIANIEYRSFGFPGSGSSGSASSPLVGLVGVPQSSPRPAVIFPRLAKSFSHGFYQRC